MGYNLFRFMSLFLLSIELQMRMEDLLLVKSQQLNLEQSELTINNETFTLSNEASVALKNLVKLLPYNHKFIFLSS